MKLNKKSGAKIAIAVAVLMASGAPLAGVANAEAGKVHCQGVNACKGKSACKTAANDCAGMNACKGKGPAKHQPGKSRRLIMGNGIPAQRRHIIARLRFTRTGLGTFAATIAKPYFLARQYLILHSQHTITDQVPREKSILLR